MSRVRDQVEESVERLAAAHTLARCRLTAGRYEEAERILRPELRMRQRVSGKEHLETLKTAGIWQCRSRSKGRTLRRSGSTARCLGCRGGYSVRSIQRRWGSASTLTSILADQGKYVDAEGIEREVLGARRRVLGEERPETLKTADNLATSLSGQGKYVEAERMFRETPGVECGYSARSIRTR